MFFLVCTTVPPGHNELHTSSLNESLGHIDKKGRRFVLAGDFNVKEINWMNETVEGYSPEA